MSTFPIASFNQPEFISALKPQGFEVSWAGAAPKGLGTFCLGSEDGHVVTTDGEGNREVTFPEPFCNRESVNGIAFRNRDWMAVTSRDRLALCNIQNGEVHSAEVLAGSHHVIATHDGHFFAPLGLNGYFSWTPQHGDRQPIGLHSSDQPSYIYRMQAVQTLAQEPVLVCAMRKGGIGRIDHFRVSQDQLSQNETMDTLDVVDVTPLSGFHLDGFAALGIDNVIVLYRSVRQSIEPLCVKFRDLEGIAYRIVAIRGLLYILTSHALYIIDRLIDHFSAGRDDAVGDMLTIPLDGIDINTVAGRWLLVLATDGILRIDLDLIPFVARMSPSQTSSYRTSVQIMTKPYTVGTSSMTYREVSREAALSVVSV